MAAAFGALRIVSCQETKGTSKSRRDGVSKKLRDGLVLLVREAAKAGPPPGARRAASGGTPGADNGLRYSLAFALEALLRSGDLSAFSESLQLLNIQTVHATNEEALLFRHCHLTTPSHPF